MQHIKIPFFNRAKEYDDKEGGLYSAEGEHGYVLNVEEDNTAFITADSMDYLRVHLVDDEPVEIPRILQPEPPINWPGDEPTPPLVETVGLLEALDGLTKLADAMRSDGVTFPPEPTVLRVPAGIEEGS